jgi:hypothetical protein
MVDQETRIEGGGSPERGAPRRGTERGERGTYDPKSGEVHGSGSGAGGGGNSDEDHDMDPMAGAGREPAGGPRNAEESVQRPIDPDEGV